MNITRSLPLPERIYEPNIIHNPRTWMGIWTPHGWRIHRKRFADASRCTVTLSGDGKTTFFPEALLDPDSLTVGWQDDLHLHDDPFTDGGLYPADPRVEYPVGRPRWAISHTLMVYPYADHNLYTHEYTWNMTHGHLQTHFRKHVALEEAVTDKKNGMTVCVQHKPISMTIEGNVHYPMPNSAVRGVWANPEKTGTNLYTRRITQLIRMHNGVYAITPHLPVVQCYGMWAVYENDPINEVFDADTGECKDAGQLIEQFHIPLDEPLIALMQPQYRQVPSRLYEGEATMPAETEGPVTEEHLKKLQAALHTRFEIGRVGYAHDNLANHDADGYAGYSALYDLNKNGIIDSDDAERLSRHIGRIVRYNLYRHAYFGGDWLTTNVCLDAEHKPGTPVIADYTYGGGYDGNSGIIQLQQTPGPNRKVWVEYHYDAPAAPGENNIRIHLYREKRKS